MITKAYTTILLLLLATAAFGQQVTGRVTDKSGRAIELAIVVVQTGDSVFVNSGYTDSLGFFNIQTEAPPFLLTVQHLSYKTYQQNYNSPNVGDIEMEEKELSLSELTVRGNRPLVKVIDGKMTYDVPQLLKNKMATSAYDAILELPGVQSQRGKIELAGANGVTIIINGKATNMGVGQLETLLKNMPKERIKEAELMYSAPPQYHVRGAVINLVLKSGGLDAPKLQGQVNGLYNQGYYANYQTGATLVYNTPKTTTDLLYSFGYNRERTGEDIVSHHLYDGTFYDIQQLDRGYSKSPVHTLRLGNDWRLTDKSSISTAYTAEIAQWTRPFTSSTGTYSNSSNSKLSDKPVQMHNLALGYTSGFGLSTGVDFTSYTNHTTQYYKEEKVGFEDSFSANSQQDIRRLTFYADQSHLLKREWAIDYGTKFSFATDHSSQLYHPLGSTDWTSSNSSSKLNEYVYDVYAGFSKSFSEALSLKASVTGEYYKHREINYWSLFPMLELNYQAKPSHLFQFSVSSDKTYPSYWEMQNTTSYLNGYTQIRGNTDLKPSLLYSAQFNYIFKGKYIFTLYGNYINDSFNQLPYQSLKELTLIYQTLNFDYSSKYGVNVVVPFKLGTVLESRLTLNGYYDRVKSSHFHNISFLKDNVAFYASLDNTFNISSKPNIKAELSGSYITRNIQGPMVISSMYRADAGVRWLSNNTNIEVSLKVTDIFNSWNPHSLVLKYDTQNLVMYMLPDTRRVSLSVVYRFGGFKSATRTDVDKSRFGK